MPYSGGRVWVDVPVGGTPPAGAPDLEASSLNGMEADIAGAYDYKPGDVVFVPKNSSGNWPTGYTADRTPVYGVGAAPDAGEAPTDRLDVLVIWAGPDPSPGVADPGGTNGMRDGDVRFVTP